MYEMRRPMLACTDETKISAFLSAAMTGYLGLADGLEPYVVPLNFVWWNGAVYVHGAEAGRKMEVLKRKCARLFYCERTFRHDGSSRPSKNGYRIYERHVIWHGRNRNGLRRSDRSDATAFT